MSDQRYPYDIHGAAQGIITFSLARAHGAGTPPGEPPGQVADRVADWTLRHMFDPASGWFHYQRGRLITKRVRLLRWCQAWMVRALGVYLESGGGRD